MYREDRGFVQRMIIERKKILVCKDEREWINPETGMPYGGFNICGIDMITSENIAYFDNCLIVIDDMGNQLQSDMAVYFAGGRHDDIQMIVIGHKLAQIFNTAGMRCDTTYITT